MGKLVGGEYLLDLTPITIAESVDGETYTNITNQNVIKQLTNLKEYIRNPKAIKPVWVKFVNDEDDAVIVTRGSLAIVDDGEFDIDVSIKGYTLKIHVEFTQATLSDSTPIDDWYIDTNDAKYLFTSDAQNIGAVLGDTESGTIVNVLGLDSDGGLVKQGKNDVVKPIYYHPISIIDYNRAHVSVYNLSFVIINNDPTPFTFATFKKFIDDLYEVVGNVVRFNCSGYYESIGGKEGVVSVFAKTSAIAYGIELFRTAQQDDHNIGPDFQNGTWAQLFNESPTEFTDGVNKIN